MTLSAFAWSDADEDYGDLLIEDYETSISGSVSMTIGKEKDLSGYIEYKELYKDSDGKWSTEWYLIGSVRWDSSFPDVVSVNDQGVAVAHQIGTARITATGWDNIGRKHVQTVVVGVSRGIKSSTTNSFEVSEGTWLDLHQIGELHSGSKDIKWASSIPDIASVDSAGLVLAHSVGRCTITASYTDESNAEQEIKYQLRVTAGSLSYKTKSSTIILYPGDEIDVGKMYYPKYQNMFYALKQYSCTTGSDDILTVSGLSVSAKTVGTGSVFIRQTDGTDETICHKLTIVVKK